MHLARTRGRSLALAAAVAFALLLGALSSAYADKIYRKNGPPLEGKIIEETATKVVLKMPLGTVTVPRRDIDRIERGKTRKDELDEKLAKLKFDDVDGLLKAAWWAEENGLQADAKRIYRRVLRLDPDNTFANRALGKVKHTDGKWYTKKELARVKATESEDRNRAAGLVKYKGRWVTREEKDKLEKGYVKRGGKWVKPGGATSPAGHGKHPRLANRDIASLLEAKLHERPVVAQSDHFRIVSMFEKDEAEALLELAEKVHAEFTEMIEEREGRRYWNLTADEFILSSRGQYLEFLDKVMPRYVPSKAAIDFFKKSEGCKSSLPPVGARGRANTPLRNVIVHNASTYLLRNYVGPRRPLKPWLVEGFAEYMEYKYEKTVRVFYITRKQYGGDVKLAEKASDSSTWPELVKTSVIDGTHTPFEKLKYIMLNELDFEHLSKSWSLMTFLIDEHEDKFLVWVKNMRKMPWEEAMYKAYRWTNAELDREWALWVKATY